MKTKAELFNFLFYAFMPLPTIGGGGVKFLGCPPVCVWVRQSNLSSEHNIPLYHSGKFRHKYTKKFRHYLVKLMKTSSVQCIIILEN